MSYAHTLGPAGLLFELLGLLDYLIGAGLPEPEALSFLAKAAGLPLTTTRRELAGVGLSAGALAMLPVCSIALPF